MINLAKVFFGDESDFAYRYVETPTDAGTAGHTEKLSARRFLHFAGEVPGNTESRYFEMALVPRPTGLLEAHSVELEAKELGINYYSGTVMEGDAIYMLSGGRPNLPHPGPSTMHSFEGRGKYLKLWETPNLDLDD